MLRKSTWVEPKLVCECKFVEWTREGRLRAPVYLGLRTDKDPHDVHRETSLKEAPRSEEHTSELQSQFHLVCRLLLEKKNTRIKLNGLGILVVRKRGPRMGRNPATGEAIKIKASKKVAFRASKELKEAI